jgi:hypothetical protein
MPAKVGRESCLHPGCPRDDKREVFACNEHRESPNNERQDSQNRLSMVCTVSKALSEGVKNRGTDIAINYPRAPSALFIGSPFAFIGRKINIHHGSHLRGPPILYATKLLNSRTMPPVYFASPMYLLSLRVALPQRLGRENSNSAGMSELLANALELAGDQRPGDPVFRVEKALDVKIGSARCSSKDSSFAIIEPISKLKAGSGDRLPSCGVPVSPAAPDVNLPPAAAEIRERRSNHDRALTAYFCEALPGDFSLAAEL